MKLSVVIPTYNGGFFFDKLMPILINQGIPPEEYEILFVDDCSTDDTREILKELSHKFPNVRYFLNIKNQKLATTCNVGLRNAKGDYVWFVDQDDEMVTGAASMLLKICYSDNLDVLLFNYCRIDEKSIIVDTPQVFSNSKVMNGQTFLHTYFEHSIVVYLFGYRWRALFRRQYLIDNRITFPDGLMHDDTIFLFQAIYNAKRMKSIAESLYLYRVNQSSYTHSVKASRIYEQYISVAIEELRVLKQMNAEDTVFIDQIVADAQNKLNSYINKVALLDCTESWSGMRMLRECQTDDVLVKFNIRTRLCRIPFFGMCFFAIYREIYRMCRRRKR